MLGGISRRACATVLIFVHYPLPWDADQPLELPPIYTMGVWLSLLLAIGFIGAYAWQAHRGKPASSPTRLAATELVARAASSTSRSSTGSRRAAAHELGTPLSTITVIATELEARDGRRVSPHADDVKLLREQAQRCRGILGKPHAAVRQFRAFRPDAVVRPDRGDRGAAPPFSGLPSMWHWLPMMRPNRSAGAIRSFSMGSAISWRTPSIFGPRAGRRDRRVERRGDRADDQRTTGRDLPLRSWTGSASLM